MEKLDSKEIRKDINAIDDMIKDLFIRRMKLVSQQQKAYKQENYILTLNTPEPDSSVIEPFANKLQKEMNQIEELFIAELDQKTDAFLKDGADYSPFADKAFAISQLGKQDSDPDKINATLGTLCLDNGQIVALNTVYDSFNDVSNQSKAAYAEGVPGNKAFRDGIYKWINRKNNISLPHDVIATSGGTGAISLCINNFVSENDTLLIPRVSWGSYRLMAKGANINISTYELIDKENNLDLTDLMLQSLKIIKAQGKLVVVINDPCQNPTGVSYGANNWKILIEFYKKLTEYGKVIIINDIAYIDYAYSDSYDYLKWYNDMNDDMLAVICFSCSKTFTAYGQRVGAAIILAQQQQIVERVANVFTKGCRAWWSNVNNGFMKAFSDIAENHLDQFNAEKQQYVDLLKQRADAFIAQAKECNLTIYPYSEGFFIFVKEEDKEVRAKAHKYLMDNHVYTLNFEGGLRVAICSTPIEGCSKLPAIIKHALEVSRNA